MLNARNGGRAISVWECEDGESPTGWAWCFEVYAVSPDGTAGELDGGMYWGYESPGDLADDVIGAGWSEWDGVPED